MTAPDTPRAGSDELPTAGFDGAARAAAATATTATATTATATATATATTTAVTVVVGLGCLDRGDDGVGRAVAAAVADEVATGRHGPVRVVVHEDPTALVELMAGVDVLVIADAVRSGAPPGTVVVLAPGPDGTLPGAGTGAGTSAGLAGTHGLGLRLAIGLAGALELLPPRTVVVGVEAAGFDQGEPMSPEAAAAVPAAVRAVLAQLARPVEHELGAPLRRSADVP